MSTWRRKAIEAVPELRDLTEQAGSPMAVWIELRLLFAEAVKGNDLSKARHIMDYARYCRGAPNADVRTAVIVGFIEHLAEDKAVRARLPDLMDAEEARAWQDVMAYHAGARAAAAGEVACRARQAVPRAGR